MLDAESSLFEAELSYSQTQGILFSDLVSIYKTMGGGWLTEANWLSEPQDSKAVQTPNE